MNANVSAGAVQVAVSAPKPAETTSRATAATAKEGVARRVSDLPDIVDLSEGSRLLQRSQGQNSRPDTVPKVSHRGSASQWEQSRIDQIDRLELLLQKGQYHVEPFMVDEIALRLARQMIHA